MYNNKCTLNVSIFTHSKCFHSLIRTHTRTHARTHTHTHTFSGLLSGTTRVGQYQKGKTNLDFTEERDSEWQWHQLAHMQVCTSLQADNHVSTPPLSFLQARCPSCRPNNSVKALKASFTNKTRKTEQRSRSSNLLVSSIYIIPQRDQSPGMIRLFYSVFQNMTSRQTRNGALVHENKAAAFRYAAFLNTFSSLLRMSRIFS